MKNKKWSLEKIRNWYWKGTYPSQRKIDPWIRPLVQFINRLPGCATICSCAGAGPVGDPVFGSKTHPDNDIPYLFMVCRSPRVMALLIMSYHKSGGFELSIDDKGEFVQAAKEEAVVMHFNNWKQMQKFEKHFRGFIKTLHTKREVRVG